MKFATLDVIDGITFNVGKEKDTRYIAIPEVEKALGWNANTGRKKIGSKSLKAFAGKELTVVKRKHPQGGHKNYLSTQDVSLLVTWDGAINANRHALVLIPVFISEALNRNIDAAVADVRTEQEHKDERQEFYRILAKEMYHPDLTAYMNGCFKGNWGLEVNKVKVAFGLPKTSVDFWGKAELKKWIDGISRYNCLRKMGKTHKQALVEIHRQRVDAQVAEVEVN